MNGRERPFAAAALPTQNKMKTTKKIPSGDGGRRGCAREAPAARRRRDYIVPGAPPARRLMHLFEGVMLYFVPRTARRGLGAAVPLVVSFYLSRDQCIFICKASGCSGERALQRIPRAQTSPNQSFKKMNPSEPGRS